MTIGAEVLSIVVNGLEIGLLNRSIAGEQVALSDLKASDDRQAVASFVYLVALVLPAVLFIRWFRAAYGNLPALGQPHIASSRAGRSAPGSSRS